MVPVRRRRAARPPAKQSDQTRPISLFYSYSHKDEDLRLRLVAHLAPLRRGGLIAEWHDRKLEPGDAWKSEIDRHLTSADIVLLLVSADFIASDYCWGEEMTKALARHDRGEARVIPVILRHCRWRSTPLARLQAVPKDAKPIKSWPDEDEAFDDVVAAIERAVETARQNGAPQQPAEAARTDVSAERDLDVAPAATASAGRVSQRPGTVSRDIDAPWCPELVVIPAGSFVMGSPEDEAERTNDEGPQHRVTFASPFALGKYPVTFEEYDHFCVETEREQPPDQGWGRERRPVINVSWDDAKAYCAWLGEQTGRAYRFPSEAEWEYACRAGTTTPFWTGETIGTEQANYDGNYTYGSSRKGEYREQTTPVDAFAANPWGLHDMHGNVWEWCEDRWHDNYGGAPSDGSAWLEGKSSGRVVRGGSWYFYPWLLRSASRVWNVPDDRYGDLGFRVSRMLTP
jgi:formylglycine-generating enzyme required for sulfatase activity